MCCVTLVILLAFRAHANELSMITLHTSALQHTQELALKRASDVQNFMEKMIDKLVLKASPVYCADLDDTMLGKPTRFASSHCTAVDLLAVAPDCPLSIQWRQRRPLLPTVCAVHDRTQLSRRTGMLMLIVPAMLASGTVPSTYAQTVSMEELTRLFNDAGQQAQEGNLPGADELWTRAIDACGSNKIAAAAAYSNRGSVRLQMLRWSDAATDLRKAAFDLDPTENPGRALALNNYGNALVALGRQEEALEMYQKASAMAPDEIGEIADENIALAFVEFGRSEDAIAMLRRLLRRDPKLYDARCALVAALYANGDATAAEGQFEELQSDEIGSALYSRKGANQGNAGAIARVRNRWPPRATAALDAFLRLSKDGEAVGWDGKKQTYVFETRR